jgi:CheY-like chemotaxis protein
VNDDNNNKNQEGEPVSRDEAGVVRVLLADVDEAARESVKAALGGLGCRVTAVGDGAAVVECAVQTVFDVVLVHVDLPVLNGAQCREAIAGLPGRHSRAAVAALLPAGANPAQRVRQRLEGFAEVFDLPLDPAALAPRLRSLVPRPAAGPAVDIAHLQRYTLGDAALEQELFDAFLPSAGRYIEQLSGTLNDDDWSRTAHALKGAARGIGAFDLGDLAARAEAEPPSTDQDRSSTIADLRGALRAVERFVAERQR